MVPACSELGGRTEGGLRCRRWSRSSGATHHPTGSSSDAGPVCKFNGADASPLTDWDAIAPWAREAVEAVVSAGLMEAEDGVFHPLGTLTRAEGEAIAARLN